MIERTLRSRLAARRAAAATLTREEAFSVLIFIAVGTGILVRAAEVLPMSFPLNDGGMFYVMVRDLQHHGYRLPATTTYNGSNIPFAYPPLGFYVAALLDDFTPLNLLTLLRLLPLLFTALTVVAFWRLAKDLLRSQLALLAAVVAFAVLPRSFIWLVMGGGLTRSLGMLLALVALRQAHRMYTTGSRRALALAALTGAGTVLSHIETGWFLCFSIALLFFAYGRTRAGLARSAVLCGLVVLLTAPWWITVVTYHGLTPFTAADGSGSTVLSNPETRTAILHALIHGGNTAEPYFPVVAGLGLLGGLVCLFTGRLFLPAWWLAIIALDFRAFATFAAIPVALMAGVAVAEVAWPALTRPWLAAPGDEQLALGRTLPARRFPYWAPAVLALGAVAYFGLFAAVFSDKRDSERWVLHSLVPSEREAMDWAAAHTPADATFLVMPRAPWEADRATEWFPALTGRRSVSTVQGTEWLDGAFPRGIQAHDFAWSCDDSTAACLESWTAATGLAFDYVYLPRGCCTTLESSLMVNARYDRVYEGPGGSIFEHHAALEFGPVYPDDPATP